MKKLNYIQSIFVLSLFAGIFAQNLIIPSDVIADAQNGFIEVFWDPIIASGFESYNIYRNDTLITNTVSNSSKGTSLINLKNCI